MSDTPRCDSFEVIDGIRFVVQPRGGMPNWPAFARELERELHAMTGAWLEKTELCQRMVACAKRDDAAGAAAEWDSFMAKCSEVTHER